MRAAFGLVGILITLGVIVWIMSAVELPSAQQAVNVQKQVTPQVQQIAGSGAVAGGNGTMRFDESLKVELESSGGQANSILVTEVDPRGPAANWYGLKRGDSIVEIGQMGPVRGMISSSDEAMAHLMQFGYQNQQSIVVIRDGQKLTLPPPGSPQAKGQGWVPSH